MAAVVRLWKRLDTIEERLRELSDLDLTLDHRLSRLEWLTFLIYQEQTPPAAPDYVPGKEEA